MRRAPRSRPAPSSGTAELTIGEIGARGDGVAHLDGAPVFVPFTVPGDRILARIAERRGEGRAATILRLLAEGSGRAVPVCRHFGACGGCALQHLGPALYAETKERLLRTALARHGLADAPLRPIRLLPPGGRRRVRFAILRPRRGGSARVGLAVRASHDIVDLTECAVLDPALPALAEPLRRLAGELIDPGEAAHATIQRALAGCDLLFDLPRPPDLAGLERLAEFATAQDLARLSWRCGDGPVAPLAERRKVQVAFAGIPVDLPAGGFLQATPAAEAALADCVLEAVGEAERIAEFHCGIGTFTFPLLARGRRVDAADGSGPAIAALTLAARRAGLVDRLAARVRDLARDPPVAEELAGCDAVLFDPPREGAKALAVALAASQVRRIVAISCNPATFVRDAQLLAAGGYCLIWIQPIDQFVWSPHLELVAAFAR